MDTGDNGDNLRRAMVNHLVSDGYSETEALWITTTAWKAVDAAWRTVQFSLEADNGEDVPINAHRMVIGLLRARLDIHEAALDRFCEERGLENAVHVTKATGAAVMASPAKDPGTIQ